VTLSVSTTKQATIRDFPNRKREDMKRLPRCTLPKNHKDYYYIRIATDKRTGKKTEQQVYPNLFIDFVSVPIKKERKI